MHSTKLTMQTLNVFTREMIYVEDTQFDTHSKDFSIVYQKEA